MKRIFLLLSACIVVSLAFAPAAMAQQGPECPTNQVNVLLENGEFICVPGGSAERTPAQDEAVANDPRSNAETPLIERPRNCDEFYGSQASAQEFFENVTPDDEFNLDPDNDGIACEGLLPGGQEGASEQYDTPTQPVSNSQYAEGTGDTEETSTLPDTSGPPLGTIGAAAGLLLVGGGLLIKRRLT